MKILDTPRSGKCGQVVAYVGRYGLTLREYVIPRKTLSPARERVWSAMGYFARAWSNKLTQPQRDRWTLAGSSAPSAARLAQSGPLTGEQLFESINCARSCINEPALWEPPAREVLGLPAVGELTIVNDENGVRLTLAVTGPLPNAVMVFAQAPCSSGRRKRRNVAYICLLPPPVNGVIDITEQYAAKYGLPKPNQRVIIVTRQQKNGWEGPDKEATDIVPAAQQAPPAVKPEGSQATAEPPTLSSPLMHTGCTGDAEGIVAPPTSDQERSAEPGTEGKKAAKVEFGGEGEGGGPG